jgi:hypothetical protein
MQAADMRDWRDGVALINQLRRAFDTGEPPPPRRLHTHRFPARVENSEHHLPRHAQDIDTLKETEQGRPAGWYFCI